MYKTARIYKICTALVWGTAVAALVGCQPGFKSKTYTDDEVRDYFIKLNGGDDTRRRNDPAHTPAAPDAPIGAPGGEETAPPPDQTAAAAAAAEAEKAAAAEKAEQDKAAAAAAEADQKTGLVSKAEPPEGVVGSDETNPFLGGPTSADIVEMPAKQANEKHNITIAQKNSDASRLLRGIQWRLSGSMETGIKIDIDGWVVARGQNLLLTVKEAAVIYAETDNTPVSAFANVTFQTIEGGEPVDGVGTTVTAWCLKEESCKLIRIQLEIPTETGNFVPVGITLQWEGEGKGDPEVIDEKTNLTNVEPLNLEAFKAATLPAAGDVSADVTGANSEAGSAPIDLTEPTMPSEPSFSGSNDTPADVSGKSGAPGASKPAGQPADKAPLPPLVAQDGTTAPVAAPASTIKPINGSVATGSREAAIARFAARGNAAPSTLDKVGAWVSDKATSLGVAAKGAYKSVLGVFGIGSAASKAPAGDTRPGPMAAVDDARSPGRMAGAPKAAAPAVAPKAAAPVAAAPIGRAAKMDLEPAAKPVSKTVASGATTVAAQKAPDTRPAPMAAVDDSRSPGRMTAKPAAVAAPAPVATATPTVAAAPVQPAPAAAAKPVAEAAPPVSVGPLKELSKQSMSVLNSIWHFGSNRDEYGKPVVQN